jgi:hypothetical protein
MFKAIVLICLMQAPEQGVCLEAHDEWGPYATRKECETRIEGMIADIKTVKNGFKPVGKKCEYQGEGV